MNESPPIADDAVTPKVETFDPDDPAKLAALAQQLGSALTVPLKPAPKRTHQIIEVSDQRGVLDATLVEMRKRGVRVVGFAKHHRSSGAVWRIKVMA